MADPQRAPMSTNDGLRRLARWRLPLSIAVVVFLALATAMAIVPRDPESTGVRADGGSEATADDDAFVTIDEHVGAEQIAGDEDATAGPGSHTQETIRVGDAPADGPRAGGPAPGEESPSTTQHPPYPQLDSVAYQLDAAHTGAHEDLSLPADLHMLWSEDLGGVLTYPLIVGDLVYVAVRGESGATVVALERTTGRRAWGPRPAGGGNPLGLAYDRGAVFAVDTDGSMRAFDARTGHQRWSITLPGQYIFTSPPTAHGGLVYTGGTGSGGTLYAVSETDGAMAWTANVWNGDRSAPAVDDAGVYVSYGCEQTFAFAPVSGVPLWHHNTACSGAGGRTPVLDQGRLYITDYFGMAPVVLDATTGAPMGGFSSLLVPAVSKGRLFSVGDGIVRAFDVDDGSALWRADAGGPVEAPPIVVNDRLFVADNAGRVRSFDVASGAQTWSASAGAAVAAADAAAWYDMVVGLAEGSGVLAVPAGTRLTVFG